MLLCIFEHGFSQLPQFAVVEALHAVKSGLPGDTKTQLVYLIGFQSVIATEIVFVPLIEGLFILRVVLKKNLVGLNSAKR